MVQHLLLDNLYTTCTSGGDSQVCTISLFSNPDPISYNTSYPRIYAVTIGNIPSVVGLAIIAVVEFAFGIALIVHAVKSPGNT